MKRQLLLLEDVYGLGHKGDIIDSSKVRPGYMRNFLAPKRLAVIADKGTLRMRERLQQEREEQAKQDRSAALAMAEALRDKEIVINVKLDPEGHMYGSVSAGDIVRLFKEELGLEIERHFVRLPKPIKRQGRHVIDLVLKEGVEASCAIVVLGEGETELPPEEVATPSDEEAVAVEAHAEEEASEE